jgi:methyltransferase-like protein
MAVQDAAGHGRDTRLLAENLLQAFLGGVLEFHVHAPPLAAEAGDCPRAPAYARFQAEAGTRVTNLRHEVVNLDDLGRHLLRHLDGTHDRGTLLEVLLRLVAERGLVVQRHGRPVTDATHLRGVLAEGLEAKLGVLAGEALLSG